jgi:hypothetical protein
MELDDVGDSDMGLEDVRDADMELEDVGDADMEGSTSGCTEQCVRQWSESKETWSLDQWMVGS